MHEYLIQQAREQIWCNPIQDNQLIFKPHRLTEDGGILVTMQFLERSLMLPDTKNRWHVFQVGRITPQLVGLIENDPSWIRERWYTIEDAMNQLPLYANIHDEKGINIPRRHTHFMFTREKCLIFAIRSDNRLKLNLTTDNIYIRLYSSAFLKTTLVTAPRPFVEVKTYEPVTNNQLIQMEREFAAAKTRRGHTEAFVNGNLVSDLNTRTVKVGDVVEWVQEVSVKRIVRWKVRSLKPFTSELDDKNKLILHYPKASTSTAIDFQDDIDIYITAKDRHGNSVGRYYVRNQMDSMRMLTHRDYAIVADYVEYISRRLAEDIGEPNLDLLDFEVVAKIREGGYNRSLINDSSRIQDLYKLSDTRIIMAMSGVDSVPPVWHAASLEKSAYTEVMRLLETEITVEDAEKAYGYNTMARMIASTPTKMGMISNMPSARLAYGLCADSTVYEYDEFGKLLGSYRHTTNDDTYEARNPNCRLIEPLMGEGTNKPSVYFGVNNLPLAPNCSFRLYHCQYDFTFNPPKPTERWVDITDRKDLYEVRNGKIVWISEETDQYLMLRTDEKFLAYSFQARQVNGVFMFVLNEYHNRTGQPLTQRPVPVPGADLQVWLNGKNLVQGIDYTVVWPNICINNYKFFNQPAQTALQDIHVRMIGFSDSDMKLPLPGDFGFVENGALSNEDPFRYHLRDERIQHISVDGGVMHRSDVRFAETATNWAPTSLANGTPYQVSDVIVPLRAFTETDTYELIKTSKQIDEEVRAYLQLYGPKPANQPVSVMPERWRLTSPFFSHLVDLCVQDVFGFLDTDRFYEEDIRRICKPYEVLLQYDPILPDNFLSESYVNVTPTRLPQSVTVRRVCYRFLHEVEKVYGQGRIGLNNFVKFNI